MILGRRVPSVKPNRRLDRKPLAPTKQKRSKIIYPAFYATIGVKNIRLILNIQAKVQYLLLTFF